MWGLLCFQALPVVWGCLLGSGESLWGRVGHFLGLLGASCCMWPAVCVKSQGSVVPAATAFHV
jgi:hypothetical protein